MKTTITHERQTLRLAAFSAALAISIALWAIIVITGKLVWTFLG